MTERVKVGDLQVARPLQELVNQRILPGTGVSIDHFWSELAAILADFSPENQSLLAERDEMEETLNRWHKDNRAWDQQTYVSFLRETGYLQPEVTDFAISTANVDPEIAELAGPQLVVPVNNARFALNAANARWGSLYDALYGTDAVSESDGCERGSSFNPKRALAVIAWTQVFLDQALPLTSGSHAEVSAYELAEEDNEHHLLITLRNGQQSALQMPGQFCGYRGSESGPDVIVLCNNGLHIELHIDPNHQIGELSPSGIKDLVLESAVSTIQDCEDSVAAVDADDKVDVYGNWLGLMQGNLEASFEKAGKTVRRHMHPDRQYTAARGGELVLPGRSLMLVRNVGLLMMTDAILDAGGEEVPEGILDAMITAACALHDLQDDRAMRNSQTGSVYIVKPKLHGPREVAFTVRLFERVEAALGMPRNTLKIGVMDEERRTTVNLKACIYEARERLIFINTGFLDRTGDEIHTSMEAGAFLPKDRIRQQPWIGAYENWNVDVGLACGLRGTAQIGKGMWAKPEEMAAMLATKQQHPLDGASCAWVPSPTAATLHATHYHQVSVAEQQARLQGRQHADLDDILTVPLLGDENLKQQDIEAELENNIQGLLGYVVRWIDQGIGCSKVPDINGVGLMEDRATLRISSQHIANWIHHGICSREQVMDTLHRMAVVVDRQNADNTGYKPMAPDFKGPAFAAACDLIFEGTVQPNGYTEPVLHHYRRIAKAQH